MFQVRGTAKFIVAVNWLIFGFEVFFLVLLWGVAVGYVGASGTFLEAFKPFLTSEEILGFNEDLEYSASILMFFGIVIAGYFLYELSINILLAVAVNKSDSRKLGVWLVINVIFLIFRTLYLLHILTKEETYCNLDIIVSDLVKTIWLALSVIVINYFRDALIKGESPEDYISQGSKFDKDPIMNV